MWCKTTLKPLCVSRSFDRLLIARRNWNQRLIWSQLLFYWQCAIFARLATNQYVQHRYFLLILADCDDRSRWNKPCVRFRDARLEPIGLFPVWIWSGRGSTKAVCFLASVSHNRGFSIRLVSIQFAFLVTSSFRCCPVIRKSNFGAVTRIHLDHLVFTFVNSTARAPVWPLFLSTCNLTIVTGKSYRTNRHWTSSCR